MHSLYVTDYSRNPALTPVSANWVPPGLEGRILKIEIWPPAAELARKMQPGEYYRLNNVRMKISAGGYLEGTMSELKITELDTDELEDHPELRDLLKCVSLYGS